MKRIVNSVFYFVLFTFPIFNLVSAQKVDYQTQQFTDKSGYTYEVVSSDPCQTQIYTLENGLKVYLSKNESKPIANCLIGVKAGSANDPINTTGLAHYLEHMMFKGTEKLGTTNWEEESKLIVELEQLFEDHRNVTDDLDKKVIYKKIDSLSVQAAQYVAINEYDNLISSIGGIANAWTDYDQTVFETELPVNELEPWLKLEKERFSGIVLRLFHTELEAVYEEFNGYQNDEIDLVESAVMKALFPNHPYGRDILGLPQHIKNPSMLKIHEFFDTFYVPNNMVICISGDIQFEKTIQLIDQYFGDFKKKELPVVKPFIEDPIDSIIVKEVYGPEYESLQMAWRFDGSGSADKPFVDIIDLILSNSQAGLLDLDLVQDQKVYDAYSFPEFHDEYSIHSIVVEPARKQKLNEAKDFALQEVNKIKKGDFDDLLIPAIIKKLKIDQIVSNEDNEYRVEDLLNEFITGCSHQQTLNYLNRLENITKDEIIKFANEHYKDNYVVVYKKQGRNPNPVKIEKPQITPIPVNRDVKSDFAQDFYKFKVPELKPEFIDFNDAIKTEIISTGCDLHYIENKDNELFSLTYCVDMGNRHNLKLKLALDYLELLGTEQYSASDFQKELFKNGLTIDYIVYKERILINLKGLKSDFEKGVELLEQYIHNKKEDQDVYDEYISIELWDRKFSKHDKWSILNALNYYGFYGLKNPFNDILSKKELKSIEPSSLTSLIDQLFDYNHEIYYYGPDRLIDVKNVLTKNHSISQNPNFISEAKKYKEIVLDQNKVFIVNYEMNQANIVVLFNDVYFSKTLLPYGRIFNQYFGDLVFQEIRESKALSYSANAYYLHGTKTNDRNYYFAEITTQTDKMKDAIETILKLMKDMPISEESFKNSKKSALKEIASDRIVKEDIFFNWMGCRDHDIDCDIRKDEYEAIQSMTMDDFVDFVKEHVSSKNYSLLLLGNKSEFDNDYLKSIGEVRVLKKKELFGY